MRSRGVSLYELEALDGLVLALARVPRTLPAVAVLLAAARSPAQVADPVPGPILVSPTEVLVTEVLKLSESGSASRPKARPMLLAGDGTGRRFVADQNGAVYQIHADDSFSIFLDLTSVTDLRADQGQRGLSVFAFHPAPRRGERAMRRPGVLDGGRPAGVRRARGGRYRFNEARGGNLGSSERWRKIDRGEERQSAMRETDRKRWSCLGSFQTRRLNVSAILFLTAIALSMSASAASVECRLSSEEGGRYGGKCVDRNEGEFALAVDLIALETSEKSLCGEAWPEGEWQGQMTIGEAAKVGVSVVCERRGDQQTLYIKDPRGWFPLADVAIDSQSWSFHYDLQGRVKTDETDTKILRRAEELLSDPSKWNREDDRQCEDDSQTQKRSLYCALHQASIDITGKYEHRRPGLQEVRFAIDEVAGEGVFDHRLRDFNNSLPFAEIQEVLRMALKSVDTCRGPGI